LVRWVLPLQVLAFGLELQVEVEVELGQPDATLKRCAMPMKMRQMGWFRVVQGGLGWLSFSADAPSETEKPARDRRRPNGR